MSMSSAGTSWAKSRERSADATASTTFIAKTASQAVATDNPHSPARGDWARCWAHVRDELGDESATGRRRCRTSQIASHLASCKRWLAENEPCANYTASQSQTNLFDLETPPRDTGIGTWGGGAAGISRRSSRRLLGVAPRL